MKLLFCSRYIDHILYHFLRRIPADVEIEVVCSDESEWSAQLAVDGLPVRHIRPKGRFDADYRRRIEALHARSGWDLIHCFHGNGELANLIQWSGGRVPIVGYRAYIGHLGFFQSPAMYWSVRNPGLAAVVAVSRAVKDYIESFRFLPARNVYVINHGVEPEWMRAQAANPVDLKAELGIEPNALVAVSVSNLRAYKRFDLVVRAAELLAGQPIHLVHLGADQGWRERASRLSNVHFLGFRPEPWRFVAGADIFLSTAHNEAFGRSNLEALACGKPLIGSDTGGLLDLVEDGVNGRFFESGNAEDLAAKVSFYEQNRQAVREHGENALDCVNGRLSSSAMAAAYLSVYEEALRVGSGTRARA